MTEYVLGNSNIFTRPCVLMEKGKILPGHAHNFDHVMMMRRGSVLIRAHRPGGNYFADTTLIAGTDQDFCLIMAGVEHEIEALEDNCRWICQYAHRTPQGEWSEKYTGWAPAYG